MPTSDEAEQLDAADTLGPLREFFRLPADTVYLDGNSLGALAAHIPDRLSQVLTREWGDSLIGAWTEHDWWSAPLRVGDRIGRLIGAAPGQVTVGESTSVQLFNALAGAARLRPGREVIVTDAGHFPTDRYLADSVARLLGMRVIAVPAAEVTATVRHWSGQVAVVAVPAVDYRTGELWDVAEVTAAAHAAGAVTVWDLCHAAGAVPLALDDDGVDLAVGCTYKYLGGGPGAPAFVYLAGRHQDAYDPPLTGWHGHAAPFAMEPEFRPADGISRTRIGTPHVLSLLALDSALDVFDKADLAEVRAKSLALGDFFLDCVADLVSEGTFEVVTPRAHRRRGSQVALRHPAAYEMITALLERRVIGDMRPPDLLRFGFNALYVSFRDVHRVADELRDIVRSGCYRDERFAVRRLIT
ncbi:kynureninase [Nocardia wallacei]|uniref:kynureninase n=1 Tax=Nocardia wallacei TaxID=480035 RepID=UPI002458F476|nr:kynureninase [Nocardia wallacei]